MDRYCSYKANSSESSILDAPLIENSGALDAELVVINDDENTGKILDLGVLRNTDDKGVRIDSDDESIRVGEVVIDGC